MPSRASATATPLRLRETSSKMREHAAGRAPRRASARSAAMRSSAACSSPCSAASRLAIGVDRLLLGGELGFGALDRGRQLVGFEHPLENLVLERLDLGLREGDLLLDRVVFLVGLHRHRLLAELREAALVDGDVLLDGAARALWLSASLLLGGGDALRARLRAAPRAPCSCSGSSASCVRAASRGRVERLQRDESFEVSVHVLYEPKKRPRRSGA